MFHGRFAPWCFEARHLPYPECAEAAGACTHADATRSLAALDALLDREGEQVACLVLEPSVQGAAGMRLQPPGFLQAVAERCARHQVHLILDEVFVACGRLGSLTVCGAEGVRPDFLCLAKGLSAGYLPLAATLTTEDIYQAFLGPFDSFKAFFHGHTFTAHPLACAVALRSLELLEARIATGELARTIRQFGAATGRLATHSCIRSVRQRGLACALELQHPDGRPCDPRQRIGYRACYLGRRHGLILRGLGDQILLVPPLVITEDELHTLTQSLFQTLDDTFDLTP